MKNKNLISFLFFALLLLGACDFITKPYEPVPPPPPPSDSTRYILLEDYTGHTCSNCPLAAITAKKIKDDSKGRVIVMGVHAGHFAYPEKSPSVFTTNFTTDAGEAYDDKNGFNISAKGNPNGMINRKNFRIGGSVSHIIEFSTWTEEVYKEYNKPALVNLKIENEYDASSRTLTSTIKSTFFYDTIMSGPYKLVLSILEDSIIAPQKRGSKDIEKYVHDHVLRDNINGIWGKELVAKGKVAKGVELTKTYTYKFPDFYPKNAPVINQTPCKVENCHIVAYIYNDQTKEVIQVAEEKVIK